MDDLISRQAAIDAVNRLSLGEADAVRLSMRIADYLNRMPPAQPEIIHCKECKYYRWESDMCDYPYATAQNVVHEDDFCSRAERRTDE